MVLGKHIIKISTPLPKIKKTKSIWMLWPRQEILKYKTLKSNIYNTHTPILQQYNSQKNEWIFQMFFNLPL